MNPWGAALAGAVAGGASSYAENTQKQIDFKVEQQREKLKAERAESFARFNYQLKDSGMVDATTGQPLSNEALAGMAPGSVQSATDRAIATKEAAQVKAKAEERRYSEDREAKRIKDQEDSQIRGEKRRQGYQEKKEEKARILREELQAKQDKEAKNKYIDSQISAMDDKPDPLGKKNYTSSVQAALEVAAMAGGRSNPDLKDNLKITNAWLLEDKANLLNNLKAEGKLSDEEIIRMINSAGFTDKQVKAIYDLAGLRAKDKKIVPIK